MAPLGDQQAEVQGGAGDPLRRRPRARTSTASPSGAVSSTRNGVGGRGAARGRRRRSPGCGRRGGRRAAAGRWARGARRARRRRPGRAPRSPSAGRWPSRRRTSAGRTRGTAPRRAPRAAPRPARPARPASGPAAAAGGCAAPSSAPSSTKVVRARRAPSRPRRAKASGSVTASRAASSVQARWAIWWATVQPAAGVGARPLLAALNPATSRSSSSLSSRRSSITAAVTADALGHGALPSGRGGVPRSMAAASKTSKHACMIFPHRRGGPSRRPFRCRCARRTLRGRRRRPPRPGRWRRGRRPTRRPGRTSRPWRRRWCAHHV